MSPSRLPLLRLFRTLVLGMLAFALVAKPMLAELCDAHLISHMVAQYEARAALAMGEVTHVDSALEARSDRDHASGGHASLHASDASPAFVELFPALVVPPAHFAAIAPPPHEYVVPPVRGFDSPFRPPIA